MAITGDKKNAFEQLMAARWLTENVGALHQAQIDQMVIWAYLTIPQAEYGELELAFDAKSKVIQVEVNAKRKKPPKGSKMRLELLQNNIRFLLGEDWDLVVKMGKVAIFGKTRSVTDKTHEHRTTVAGVAEEPPKR